MDKLPRLIVLTGLLLGLSVNVPAATVTLFGTDVNFTFDDASLFGTANVVGNSIFFQPSDFKAESIDGAGIHSGSPTDSLSETLNITVNVNTGSSFNITSLAMVEQGDYILDGAGTSVSASGLLGVSSLTTTCEIFACDDFTSGLFNAGPFSDTGGSLVAWSGGSSVDLADTAGWGSDTSLQISFQNNLTAVSPSGSTSHAMIQKKAGAVGLVVNPVPVPAAAWLFGSGLLGLIGLARRKKT